jgi:hypothetical protein
VQRAAGVLADATLPPLGFAAGRRLAILTYLRVENIKPYYGCYVVAPKGIIVSENNDRIVVPIKTAASLNLYVINNFFVFIVRDDFSDRSEPYFQQRLACSTDESSSTSPKLRPGPRVVLYSPSRAPSTDLGSLES